KLGVGKELNCAMSNLRDGIENKEDMKRRSGYMNADRAKVRGYDEGAQKGENMMNGRGKVELNKGRIEEGLSDVEEGEEDVDGVE
ncbi:FIVAR domain-containing protein, partial [Staphylococcus epidermidis]|uniref:FIVAR domain-containing protein n=1 Tax=Staphylococcus epidermidis TaxID=1282 RepID=UPI001C92F2B5